MTLNKCLSSFELEDVQIPTLAEARKAFVRIADKDFSEIDLILAISYLSHALYESTTYRPRLTQLLSLCILILSHEQEVNRLLEVLTGEGKSCIIAMFAAALGMQGKKVDIITSSPVLAKRDALSWAKFYGTFELTTADNTDTKDLLMSDQCHADKIRGDIYGCDIVYGTVSSFSADILREEFEMRKVRSSRGFQAAIIDEVDMLMMDEGVQFTYLSHRVALLRHIEPVIALVWSAVQQHPPLITNDGDILFADVPKFFLNIILDNIDLSGHPELEEEVNRVHQLPDLNKTTAIQSLFDRINTSEAACVNVYMFDEDNKLQRRSERFANKEEQILSVLVADKGRVRQLYTQEKLGEGVKGIVLGQCDISRQDILCTTDGSAYVPGDPGVFDKVLSNLNSVCQSALSSFLLRGTKMKKIKKVLESEDVTGRLIALEDIKTQDMLSFIEQLNKHQTVKQPSAFLPLFWIKAN